MSYRKENCQQRQKHVCCAATDLGVEGRKDEQEPFCFSGQCAESRGKRSTAVLGQLIGMELLCRWPQCAQGPLLDSVFWTVTMSGGES